MTIHEDAVRALLAKRDEAPVVHRITLTKDDFTAALCVRACQRLGIDGSFASIFSLKYKPDGEFDCVEAELIPTAFVEGAPIDLVWPLPSLETNAERIVRETPQATKDQFARVVQLARLNEDVTAAILRAEQHPPGQEASLAWRGVATIEVAIAHITSPDSLEGATARCGAITASISAGDWLRAKELAETYLGTEQAPADLTQRLLELRAEALAAWQAGSGKIDGAATDFPKSDT